ncbi:MAG: hypothetical protein WCH44_16425 [Betaproteobacteria bacterium]
MPFSPGAPSVLQVTLTLALAAGLGVAGGGDAARYVQSMVVSFGVLLAALAFFWPLCHRPLALRWHGLLLLPLLAHARASTVWSRSYLWRQGRRLAGSC